MEFTDEQKTKLLKLAAFSDEDFDKLASLLAVSDEIEKDQRRKMAWRLVIGSGRSLIMGLGGLVAMGIIVWNAVKFGLASLISWAGG